MKSAKAKKISFQKVEEKENSIPTLIQKGEIEDIKKLLEDDPSGKGSMKNRTHVVTILRVNFSSVILFLNSMSETCGSDIEGL